MLSDPFKLSIVALSMANYAALPSAVAYVTAAVFSVSATDFNLSESVMVRVKVLAAAESSFHNIICIS